MSENQAVLDKEKDEIDTLESYRKIMFGDMIGRRASLDEIVELWVTNRKSDHWWLYAKSKRHHRSWCAQIVGSDDETSANIAKQLIKNLITGKIIDEVDANSIEVLKADESMQKKGECIDLSGIVLQAVTSSMPESEIPEDFRLHWGEESGITA